MFVVRVQINFQKGELRLPETQPTLNSLARAFSWEGCSGTTTFAPKGPRFTKDWTFSLQNWVGLAVQEEVDVGPEFHVACSHIVRCNRGVAMSWQYVRPLSKYRACTLYLWIACRSVASIFHCVVFMLFCYLGVDLFSMVHWPKITFLDLNWLRPWAESQPPT